MSHTGTDLRDRLDRGPMSPRQWSAVAVCVLLNVLDGFDVLVMAFTADSVSDEWGLSGSELGLLLSAGLIGMAMGSMLLGPLADRLGRRALVVGCLVVAASGMGLSAVSQSALQLGVLRWFTGIGIGGILAASNVLAAEYANRRWRGLAVSLNSSGYAIGATAGGILAASLQSASGWRPVFACGAVATALLIPAVLWRLPESIDFLLTQRTPRAHARLNAQLVKMRQEPLDTMPTPVKVGNGAPLRHILSPSERRNTLLSWTGFFLAMASFYFVTSWTPKLLVEAGMSADEGITGGVLLNVGGIFGTAVLGLLAARFPLRPLLAGYMIATAGLLVVFVAVGSVFALVLAVGALIGLFINGCVAGLYALTPSIYAPSVRGTGVGWAIGVGRIGAILSPIIAGRMLDAGATPGTLYLVVAVLLVLGGLTVRAFRLREDAPSPAGGAKATAANEAA